MLPARYSYPAPSSACIALISLMMALAVQIRCADYGGEQGFLGLASLPAAAAIVLETETPDTGTSPVESITQVTSTTITGTTSLLTVPTVDLTRSFVVCNQTSFSSQPRSVVTCALSAAARRSAA